jgi:hypothetical protein
MMTRTGAAYVFCTAFMAIAICRCPALFGETAPPEAITAAQSGLPAFLEKIPAGDSRSYGFEPGDPIHAAYPGAPYRLHEITPAALARFKPGDAVDSLTRPAGMWYFPVMIRDEVKAILIVDYLDGAWRAVSLGQAPLARELNSIRRQWPKESGYSPSLVVNFQSAGYFFTVPQVNDHNLTPILPREARSGAALGRPGYASTGELSGVVEMLKPVVENSISQAR